MSAHAHAQTVKQPKMVSVGCQVIAGPERARLMGVPVGTVVETREMRLYRNPLRQLLWRLRHPGSGPINLEGSVT